MDGGGGGGDWGRAGTHSCIFPWEAEKGVWASPVSHVFQNRQKLHGMTRLWEEHTRYTQTKTDAIKTCFGYLRVLIPNDSDTIIRVQASKL